MKTDERDERMDEMEETLREWMKDLEPEEIEGLVSEDSFWESPGAAMSPADRRTIRRKVYQRIRRRAPWTAFGKGVAAAACIMLLLLVWQKDTVQAGLEKLFQMIPGVGLYESRESWYYSLVPSGESIVVDGWEITLTKGYLRKQPDTEYEKDRGELVLRLEAVRLETDGALKETEDTKEDAYEDGSAWGTLHLRNPGIYHGKEYLGDGTTSYGHEEDDENGRIERTLHLYGMRMKNFQAQETYEAEIADGKRLSFTLEEPEYMQISALSETAGEEAALAVETSWEEEGLLVQYYPYCAEEKLLLTVPDPKAFGANGSGAQGVRYDMGAQAKELIPYLTCGQKRYELTEWKRTDAEYSELVETLFDAEAGEDYTLHVPYMVAAERSEYQKGNASYRIPEDAEASELLTIPELSLGERAALDYRKTFAKGTVHVLSAQKISGEEAEELLKMEEVDFSGWEGIYLEMEAEEEASGFSLFRVQLAFKDIHMMYSSLPAPVVKDGVFKGMVLLLSKDRPAEGEEDGSGLVVDIGNPSYLYKTDFSISHIR